MNTNFLLNQMLRMAQLCDLPTTSRNNFLRQRRVVSHEFGVTKEEHRTKIFPRSIVKFDMHGIACRHACNSAGRIRAGV